MALFTRPSSKKNSNFKRKELIMNGVRRIKHYLFLRKLPPMGSYGGCEKVLLDWFNGVDYEKYKITLAVTKGTKDIFKERTEWNKLNLEILEFSINPKSSFIKKVINMLVFLRKVNPTHIVFMQGSFFDFNLAEVLASYMYTFGNVFMTEHMEALIPEKLLIKYHFGFIPGLGLWWRKQKVLYLLRAYLSKRILAISNTVKERLIRYYSYPKNRIYVAYHGIEINKFIPDIQINHTMRDKYSIPIDDIVIISTSRLSREKRLDRIINAFDMAYEKYKNIWLFMVGNGPQEEELQELARKKLSKEHIKFLGFQEDVSNYLKMSDIYVLSSGIEEFAIAMLEAMASGVIAVITKVDGSYSLIKDGENGFLVEPTDEGVMEGITKSICLNEEERKQLSYRSRKFAEKYEIQNSVKEALIILGLQERY